MSETVTDLQEPVIPPAVRRAAAEADRLAAEATAEAQARNGEPAPQDGVPAENTTTVVEQPGEPAPSAPPAPPAPPAEPAKDAAYWEQRYRSIQGKYDAELPDLRAQLRASQAHIVELNGRIAELNMRSSQPAAAAKGPEIAPEDVETYGQDFIDKVRAWTAGSAGPDKQQIDALKQQVASLQTQVATTSVDSAKEAVKTVLDRRVPNWNQIDHDPAFHAWLAQSDPFSGYVRHNMLTEAFTNGDAERTLRFFEAFIAEQTATRGAGITPGQTPPPEVAATVPLTDLVAPGRGRPANPGAPADNKRVYTHKEITAFYSDVARGRYRNHEAERARLERDIHIAAGEGRTRP